MGPRAGRHALIVEDELLIGIGMQDLLESLGFDSFAFASTQKQALEQLRLRRPDIVTIDLGLLDGDGVGAAEAIRAESASIPIVFVTGDPQAVANLPGEIVVEKPVSLGDLARACDLAEASTGQVEPRASVTKR